MIIFIERIIISLCIPYVLFMRPSSIRQSDPKSPRCIASGDEEAQASPFWADSFVKISHLAFPRVQTMHQHHKMRTNGEITSIGPQNTHTIHYLFADRVFRQLMAVPGI
jgi:hypothetical protein